MLGTIMAANVFFNIIPAHRELIRAKEEGRDPDPAPGIEAKRRSVHNNYFTLPVLITMLAGHFAFLTAHEQAWLILLALMALGAWSRLFFNLRHSGTTRWWMLAAGAGAVIALAIAARPDTDADRDTDPTPPPAVAADGRAVFTERCASCHTLADADATGQVGPNLDDAAPDATHVVDVVTRGTGRMPALAGTLRDEEIDAVAVYVATATGS
jgi:uncharacterized membrane protein